MFLQIVTLLIQLSNLACKAGTVGVKARREGFTSAGASTTTV